MPPGILRLCVQGVKVSSSQRSEAGGLSISEGRWKPRLWIEAMYSPFTRLQSRQRLMQSRNVRGVTGDVGMKLMMRKDLMIRERMRKWTSTLVDPQTRELVQCYMGFIY